MPSSVVASRSHGSGIAATVGLVLIIVAACGQAATTPTTPAERTAVPSTALASDATKPTATPRPTAGPTVTPTRPAPIDLGERLIATIDGIAKPCAMAATETAIWVTGNSPTRLARIDPSTNEIVDQTSIDGTPCGIALGSDGRIWVALLGIGEVIAVDPATGKVDATVKGFGSNLWDLKAGYGAVWVVDRTTRQVVRIDPDAAAVAGRADIGRSGSGLALTGGAVWVVDDLDGTVRRIDPTTMAVTTPITLRRGAAWFADDRDSLAVANAVDGSITPIDSAKNEPRPPVVGATGPLDGTVLAGRAYVPDGKAHTLVEVDLASGKIESVDRLEGGVNPFVAEVAFGSVWVLDYGGKRIWRLKP